jgi:class 3 adenylate cyclase/tetratricopeptide (TPR) repeat protein
MRCPACETENEAGRKFCAECGGPLARACPACGTANAPAAKFCGECGTALLAQAADVAKPPAQPATERRLVSVLFADLVGFTTASEGRDAEETRDLLSRYFETARTLIERYGGTVEKFIGDAVMAVWGTPVAQEDDAERAVRAALDLVAAVRELDERLQARAGVLTGEAAVTLGAQGQGMVAGDLVNTASRIQSAAEPGTVLVGDATKRATDAAIAFDDGGEHALKGKADPVRLWRALRVTAARGGALKAEGLEPPFVGRDRELRLVKELFHGAAEENKAHLVSVVGIAGIGKSRLAWEFEKYIDGLAETIFWWRGRCLAYGEGVAYWALAEMVRTRADIVEGEDPQSARAKLTAGLAEYIGDADERAWIEPRLAHLLGLEARTAPDREDLFAAWRLYFERLSEHQPAVLVFEDMQWADASLLEFIEYLLEWARSHPIFVLTLARPELAERHPGWGAGRRNFTALALEPLSETAMQQLLGGLVPGLPDELQARILARAEGVPLYAVETVRMLLDRGVLVREGDRYHPVGEVAALDVPETLHALVAARLDGLAPEERRIVQDASVLGKTFTKQALAALMGEPEADVETVLRALVRKEVLSIQSDPRSPERGQYGFLQDLLRHVAYETLARSERKRRHLAAAAVLVDAFGSAELEIAEVVASHYVEAYSAAPEAEDAADIKATAQEHLARAGERAASLAASGEAQRYFEQAAELAGDPITAARLVERAGEMAVIAGRSDEAKAHLQRAATLFEHGGESHPAARVSARLSRVLWQRGEVEEARALAEQAFAALSGDEPDEHFAAVAAELARLQFFTGPGGESGPALERIELALEIAESLRLPETITHALITKSLILGRRPEEAEGLLRHGLQLALEHDLSGTALRAYTNLGDLLKDRDRVDEAITELRDALTLARVRGDRGWELNLLGQLGDPLCLAGEWDEPLANLAELRTAGPAEARYGIVSLLCGVTRILTSRGRPEEAATVVASIEPDPADWQERSLHALATAILLRTQGAPREALAAALEATRGRQAWLLFVATEAFAEAAEAALALDDVATVEELLASLDELRPVERTQTLQAHQERVRARLAARSGDAPRVDSLFKRAAASFREIGMPFWLAVTLLEHGEWLVEAGRGDDAEALLAEAREIFERLEATPWLERLERVRPQAAVA